MSGRKNGQAIAITVDDADTSLPQRYGGVSIDAACRLWLAAREPAAAYGRNYHIGNRNTKAERSARRRRSTK